MSKPRPPISHPLTSQLQYQFILGPIKIKDGLFIGDQYAAKDIQFIHTNKVTHIINTVSRRIPNIWQKVGVQYLSFNWTESDWNVNIGKIQIFDKKNTVINTIFAFIQEAMDLGECCLIHSMYSKSRSFLVVAAYLMKKYSWSLDKIFSFVNSKKPKIQIKGVYMKQLKELEERMNKIHAFSLGWEDAKNQEDMILKNTYINSFPIQFSEVYKPGKGNGKKLTWLEAEGKGNRFKDESSSKKKVYESVKELKKEDSKELKVVKSILKQTGKTRQSVSDEPTNIINNINGNIIHVTVNNFITPDEEIKTATKPVNPVMTRPYSSDTKDKKREQVNSGVKQKSNPYQSFFNFKSKQPGQKPKRTTFGSSKIGMNDTFKKSSDNFKQTYQRPMSAAHQDKKKPMKTTGGGFGGGNPLIKDMMITNTTKPFVGGRYPSPMVKDNSSIGQLREKWRREI